MKLKYMVFLIFFLTIHSAFANEFTYTYKSFSRRQSNSVIDRVVAAADLISVSLKENYDCKCLAVTPVTHVGLWATMWSISIVGNCSSVKSIKLAADSLTAQKNGGVTGYMYDKMGGTFNLIIRTESDKDDIFTLNVLK